MKIKLDQVIEMIEMGEMSDDMTTSYYDKQTGQIVTWMEDFPRDEDDEALTELMEDFPKRFAPFPTRREIHAYRIMESFVNTLPNGAIRQDLARAICGKGAFRRFKQAIRYHGMEHQWYNYQAAAYRDIAIRWCQENGLDYEGKEQEEQLGRITHMEQLLNESTAAISALDKAITHYRAVQEKIAELQHYYEDGQWSEDFDADRDGKLPKSLPRGVLTEDAIYDLLSDRSRMKEVFLELAGEAANE